MTGWNVLKCGTFKLDPCDNVRIDLNHCSRRFGGIFQCHWCLYSIAKIFWKFNIQIHLIKKGQIMLIKPKCNSINVVNKTYMKKGLMRILILTFPLNTTLQVERNYLTLQMFYMLPAMLLMTCNSTKTSGIMVYNMIYFWEHLKKNLTSGAIKVLSKSWSWRFKFISCPMPIEAKSGNTFNLNPRSNTFIFKDCYEMKTLFIVIIEIID